MKKNFYLSLWLLTSISLLHALHADLTHLHNALTTLNTAVPAATPEPETIETAFAALEESFIALDALLNKFTLKDDSEGLFVELRKLKTMKDKFIKRYKNSAEPDMIKHFEEQYDAMAKRTEEIKLRQENFTTKLAALETEFKAIEDALVPPSSGLFFWKKPKVTPIKEIHALYVATQANLQQFLEEYGMALEGTRPALVDAMLKRLQTFDEELKKRAQKESLLLATAKPVQQQSTQERKAAAASLPVARPVTYTAAPTQRQLPPGMAVARPVEQKR